MLLDEKAVAPHLYDIGGGQAIGTARIKVVGVGGAGVNAVRRVGQKALPGIELLCLNTDSASLSAAQGIRTIELGPQSTKGGGAGGDPEVGRRAAQESLAEISEEFRGIDLVFIAAGMGGGTGTGAAPVVAAAARSAGAVTVGVVTTPFQFEGTKRKLTALKGLLPLQEHIDTLIMVNNQELASAAGRNASVQTAFALADGVMVQAILAVSRIITTPGEVNIDFADIRSVLRSGGLGLMGIGRAEGDRRLINAVRAALAHPLVDLKAHGARGVLYFISAGPDVTLGEITDAGAYIASMADPEAQIFFGLNTEPNRGPGAEVEVVIIATHLPQDGFGGGNVPFRRIPASGPTLSFFQADERPPSADRPRGQDDWPSTRAFS